MRCYKKIEDGYIIAIGTGVGGGEISAEEYAQIKKLLYAKPEALAGYDYRLKEDLTWEEYEVPAIDPGDEEISDEEALSIILGGDA